MKRIIEIPEELYSNIVIDNCSLGEVCNLLGIVAESTPFDSVIEDIKAEINKEMQEHAEIKDYGRYYGLHIALEIIDNHISGKEK